MGVPQICSSSPQNRMCWHVWWWSDLKIYFHFAYDSLEMYMSKSTTSLLRLVVLCHCRHGLMRCGIFQNFLRIKKCIAPVSQFETVAETFRYHRLENYERKLWWKVTFIQGYQSPPHEILFIDPFAGDYVVWENNVFRNCWIGMFLLSGISVHSLS